MPGGESCFERRRMVLYVLLLLEMKDNQVPRKT